MYTMVNIQEVTYSYKYFNFEPKFITAMNI